MNSISGRGQKRYGLAVLAVLSLAAGCATQEVPAGTQILKQEPGAGELAGGKVAYIDDGSCPKGEVKGVRGGAISDLGLRTTVWCAKRPAD